MPDRHISMIMCLAHSYWWFSMMYSGPVIVFGAISIQTLGLYICTATQPWMNKSKHKNIVSLITHSVMVHIIFYNHCYVDSIMAYTISISFYSRNRNFCIIPKILVAYEKFVILLINAKKFLTKKNYWWLIITIVSFFSIQNKRNSSSWL